MATDPLLGQLLGAKLRVRRRIGQGGMGTVYVAEHLALGKPVAVKVLSTHYGEPGQPASPGAMTDLVRRLHTEARHTAAIKNEHIVEIFDIGTTEDGRPYVEMELLTGESLAQRLARCSALSEADTLRLGRQLASALAAAHKSGIVHRDIKPENIFLCAPAAYGKDPSDGDFVKVLDFGISKAVRALELGELPGSPALPGQAQGPPSPEVRETRDPRLTRTGAILGTPLYMSPEQVRGEPLDHRVDVYAVGVVLYECLTGSVPHGACNYLAVVAKILTESPEPPSQRSPERSISPELEHIVLRAMATDLSARYPTMEAVLEDLRRYAAGQELLPQPGAGLPGTADPSGAPLLQRAGVGPAGASGLGDSGGALGHLWWPILLGMVLVLGLGGGVAAVLRPRGPWNFTPTGPTAGSTGRGDARTAGPAAANSVAADARRETTVGIRTQGPGPQPAGPTPPVTPHPNPAVLATDGGEPQLSHRLLHPRPPAAASAHSPAGPSPGDALLLDEQAPNPFVAPSSPGRADKPVSAPPTRDDTSADPR